MIARIAAMSRPSGPRRRPPCGRTGGVVTEPSELIIALTLSMRTRSVLHRSPYRSILLQNGDQTGIHQMCIDLVVRDLARAA
jgi:hypothetical protein